MTTTLQSMEHLSGDLRLFKFAKPDGFTYIPGQFIQLHIPHLEADERGEYRWFSLTSSPTEPFIAITTRFNTAQLSSFKRTLGSLQPGSPVEFTGPMGDFTLVPDQQVPLVFVAGGIGITPLRSMAKWLADSGSKRPITLIYGAAIVEQMVYQEVFTAAGITVIPVVAQPPADWQGETGQLDAARVLALANAPADAVYYVSGPKPMVQALGTGLQAAGIDAAHLKTDEFSGYVAV